MAREFHKGDRVRWDAGNQSSVGTIEDVITSDTHAGGRHVVASVDEPQYLVRSEKSGRTAVHHADKIHPA
jgi:Hypervirulence associated proteins TUDOR domain